MTKVRTGILKRDRLERGAFLLTVTCLLIAIFFLKEEVWRFLLFLLALLSLLLSSNRESHTGSSVTGRIFFWGLTTFAAVNFLAVILAPELPGMTMANRDNEYFYGAVLALSLGFGSRKMAVSRDLMLIFLVLSAIYVCRELIWLDQSVFTVGGRLSGLDGLHPNRLAMILLFMAAAFLAGLQMLRSRIAVLAGLAMFFVTAYLLMLTGSRFALLTFGFVTIPSALLFQRRWGSFRQKVAAACLILFLLAPLGGLLWYMKAGPERRSPINIYGRLAGWTASIYFVREGAWYRAIIGYGDFKQTFTTLADHYDVDLTPFPGLVHAHNVPLQVFMETGVIGVVLMVLPWWVVFSILIRTWTTGREEHAALAGCLIVILLTVVVASQMDFTLAHISGRMVHYFLGTAFTVGVTSRQGDENPLFPS
jgi:O-antigen ligase